MALDANGPYTGKPDKPVELACSINKEAYPPGAFFQYQWYVGTTSVETDGNGKAEYFWTAEGNYSLKCVATVTTSEGLVLSGSAFTNVAIEAGKPTAMPGGHYRGGIHGGNYSPIQFAGNHPDFVEDEQIGKITVWEWTFPNGSATIYNPTCKFTQAGKYTISLKVKSRYGKWSVPKTAEVNVIDGKIAGYVRAADLRTPVKEVRLTLSSSHVDSNVLAQIAADSDWKLNTTGDGGLWTLTDDNGYYEFAHIPLGSYRIRASKGEGDNAHEFETSIQDAELTLDSPNRLAINFVDISVYPVGGRIVYSIQKNGQDVLSDGVKIRAQSAGGLSEIEALPSNKSLSATGVNYSLPLFAGKYLFLAEKENRDIRINEETQGYDKDTQLVTIKDARTDIDFIDYTTRKLTVFVADSGGYVIGSKTIIISGDNGQAEGISDEQDGKFASTLNPGKYLVSVKGAMPETREVELINVNLAVTMVIPSPIELSVSPRPKLFDLPTEFLEQFGLKPEDNPEGYMYYYPPQPRAHTYTVTATSNGHPVKDWTLYVLDEVGMMTPDSPLEQELFIGGQEGIYTMFGGLPKRTGQGSATLAAPKKITFWARKDGYTQSNKVEDTVTVLGDVAEGSVAKIVSVPMVNYLVLHDPPGDGSYSFFDDSMSIKGMVVGLQIISKDMRIPVYPSPWRDEREVSGFEFEKESGSETGFKDMYDKGLLGYKDSHPTPGWFALASVAELAAGDMIVGANAAAPGVGHLLQLAKMGAKGTIMGVNGTDVGLVQYEITPNRRLETPSGDTLPDILGVGKGDVYYGEGWTLGLQNKYRLGIRFDTSTSTWDLVKDEIMTYDILERTNQYIYTIRDIEKIVEDLGKTIADIEEDLKELGTETDEYKQKVQEKIKLIKAKNTWQYLLNNNLAYQWNKNLEKNEGERVSLDAFLEENGLKDMDMDNETLIFSAGPKFEYSRNISVDHTICFSSDIFTESASEMGSVWSAYIDAYVNAYADTYANAYVQAEAGLGWPVGVDVSVNAGVQAGVQPGVIIGMQMGLQMSLDSGANLSWGTGVGLGGEWESGYAAKQSVGFVLHDDDIGDNFTTRIYEDPRWGTPLFFQEQGCITSDPWEAGTNKAVDVTMELTKNTDGTFDYQDGAHYKVKLTYTGQRKLQSSSINFLLYAPAVDNKENLTVRFNGYEGHYGVELSKKGPVANVVVSVWPPEIDQKNSEEKEYSFVIGVSEDADDQIYRFLPITVKFADLRAPRAVIIAPYAGQRVSPALFAENPFKIQVVSSDMDIANIQLQIRSKQPDGVWEPWRNLSGMKWEGTNTAVVTLFERLDRVPPRYEFTFHWTEVEMSTLGVGEYSLQAIATDKAGNVDICPLDVVFLVDESKPSVLCSIPDYQASEAERIYRGELSVLFTDDMRATDFTDRTFSCVDLLDNNKKVAGYVSYSPALRKAIFVPIVLFQPYGFYRVEIKTDTEMTVGTTTTIEQGVHDLAGNPLDNAFMWTFRTKDAPFEQVWSIGLSVTDGIDLDGNNIAGVEFGALDGTDEKDAPSVPGMASQMRVSYLDRQRQEFDRDTRPADGRLSHHWFFVIDNAKKYATITLSWQPSLLLTKNNRQYQVMRLVEFDANNNVTNNITLDPTKVNTNQQTGDPELTEIYTYINNGETSRYFRLDVQKVEFVAKSFKKGSSGWKFFSVPVTPQRAEPFVNLGDDIDPFKLYEYKTDLGGYKIYPFDIGEVSLQTRYGYWTRLENDVEVDVGGASNFNDMSLELNTVGWHAIGNPFILAVNVADLEVREGTSAAVSFAQAVSAGLLEGTLYRWDIVTKDEAYMSEVPVSDSYEVATSASKLETWEGYWLKNYQAEYNAYHSSTTMCGNSNGGDT